MMPFSTAISASMIRGTTTRLATALWERPERLDRLHAEDFAAASTDAQRKRVVRPSIVTTKAPMMPFSTAISASMIRGTTTRPRKRVSKGIIGAFVVTIDGRRGLYKEQRRVLKRLATALWERPERLDRLHAEDFAATTDRVPAGRPDR
jgi:hypothetical protein